ncbi:fibrinogen-related protein 1 [Plakobranchus ocellatus]|uniref:Fibrinogen-related protein 1 n=1 Tax=Plakobranchus ocellatus TaxID=259542 RepID=A0AAV4AJQ9_9GAST|nr:fibrinogen-related protein 1 [Plakobranchus ocellatus]
MAPQAVLPSVLALLCLCTGVYSASVPTTAGGAFSRMLVRPQLIDEDLTESMEMECSLDDSLHIVSHIVSIVILRQDGQNKNILVASVTSFDPAKPAVDYGSLAVFGSVDLPRNHLKLVWDHPGATQASNYTCEINAIDAFARPMTLLTSYAVTSRVPTTEVMIRHIRQLENRVDTLEQILAAQNNRLQELEKAAGLLDPNTTGKEEEKYVDDDDDDNDDDDDDDDSKEEEKK